MEVLLTMANFWLGLGVGYFVGGLFFWIVFMKYRREGKLVWKHDKMQNRDPYYKKDKKSKKFKR